MSQLFASLQAGAASAYRYKENDKSAQHPINFIDRLTWATHCLCVQEPGGSGRALSNAARYAVDVRP